MHNQTIYPVFSISHWKMPDLGTQFGIYTGPVNESHIRVHYAFTCYITIVKIEDFVYFGNCLIVKNMPVFFSPGTGEFPAQMASYAVNASIWWRHVAGRCRSTRELMEIHENSKVFQWLRLEIYWWVGQKLCVLCNWYPLHILNFFRNNW